MSYAHAIDLSWQPHLKVETRATDNLRSRSTDQEAAWGFDTGGGIEFKAESATWRSVVNPAFNIRRFVIGEDADADEYEVRTENQWQFIERATASLAFDYIRDSTLSTELSDAGIQNAVVNRDTINVSPGLGYALTERTSLNAGFYYSDVNFEDREGIFFNDYEFKQFNAGASHIYNERLTFFANGYISEFETPETNNKSLTYGGQGGVTIRYSETLDGDFGVGYTQSEIDFQTQRNDGFQFAIDPVTGQLIVVPIITIVDESVVESGPIASASIRKQFEYLSATLDYSRAVSPSAFGAQTVADDIELMLDRPLTQRLRLNFRGGYSMRSVESDALTGTRANLNRNQVLLSTSLRYRLTEEFTVAANYRFFWNELVDIERNVYNNTLFFTLSYNGEPHFYRGF
ncbi:MAG: hypothetical protein WD928_06045 [Gammaproteobacteria bacterium]